jgi:hypothetical protein
MRSQNRGLILLALFLVGLAISSVFIGRSSAETAKNRWRLQVTTLNGRSVEAHLDMRLSDEQLLTIIRRSLDAAFPEFQGSRGQQQIGTYICTHGGPNGKKFRTKADELITIDNSTPLYVAFDPSHEFPYALGTIESPHLDGRFQKYDHLKSERCENLLRNLRLTHTASLIHQ